MKLKKEMVVAYLLFIFLFIIFSYSFLDSAIPFFSFVQPLTITNRALQSGIYVLSILVFMLFYGWFFTSVTKDIRKEKLLKTIVICTSFLLISYPAMLSYDIYNYIATAKVTFFYGENPYIIMPIEFVGEPMVSFMHAANKTALYGPFWIFLTAIPFFLGFTNFIVTLFLTKLLVAGFYFAILYLLNKMTKNTSAIALFALHPLVILETFVSSHNDIVMMFFALSGFYLLQKRRIALSLSVLLFSILIKFATIVLLPIFLYVIFKQIRRHSLSWDKVFLFSFIAMFGIFILSFMREEIYPWYAIWFLVFLPFVPFSKFIRNGILVFSCSLLFRYVPFMLIGSHFGITPYIKWVITFLPVLLYLLFIRLSKK